MVNSKILVIVMLVGIFAGCAIMRPDVRQIKTGMLKQGIVQTAFLQAWGQPDKISSFEANNSQAQWGNNGFTSGGKSSSFLVQWDYSKHNTSLFFSDDELVSWKTDKTIAELKAIAD